MFTSKFAYTMSVVAATINLLLAPLHLVMGKPGFALWTLALGVAMVFISYQNAKGITDVA